MFDGFCFANSRKSRSAAAYCPALYSCAARSAVEFRGALDCPEQIDDRDKPKIATDVTEISFIFRLQYFLTSAHHKDQLPAPIKVRRGTADISSASMSLKHRKI